MTSQLTFVRLGFFFVFGALASFSPYLSVLYHQAGFSASQNGLLNLCSPICTLFVTPLVCRLVERTHTQTFALYTSVILGVILMFPLCLAHDNQQIIVVSSIAFFICTAPYLPLYDEHSMAVLIDAELDSSSNNNNKEGGTDDEDVEAAAARARASWGGFRVWGAYAWLVGAPAASALMQFMQYQQDEEEATEAVKSNNNMFKFTPFVFAALNACFLFCVWSTRFVKRHHSEEKKDGHHGKEEKQQEEGIWDKVFRADLRIRLRLINFLVALVVAGVGYSVVATFLFVYLTDELRAPPLLLGSAMFATLALEIPLFRNSDRLHSVLTDSEILLLGLWSWVIRAMGYAVLPNKWVVLIIEPLHGMTFGCMWLSGMSFLTSTFRKIAGGGSAQSTATGLLHAASFGLGPILGNIVGGHVYEEFGPRTMFIGFACGISAMGVLFWCVDRQLATT